MALVQVQLGAIPLAIRRAIMVAEFIAGTDADRKVRQPVAIAAGGE